MPAGPAGVRAVTRSAPEPRSAAVLLVLVVLAGYFCNVASSFPFLCNEAGIRFYKTLY